MMNNRKILEGAIETELAKLKPVCGVTKTPPAPDYFCSRELGHEGPCAAHVIYQGITHGRPTWRWYLWIRRRYYCPRGVHLFDETQTTGNETGWDHFLNCDACNLMVEIGRISKEYVMGNRDKGRKEVKKPRKEK